MATLLLTLIILEVGIIIAGIPIGICAVVKSAKISGWLKGLMLPLSIISLILSHFGIVMLITSIVYFFSISIAGIIGGIVTLSVSSHFVKKQNAQSEENVSQSNKYYEREEAYIAEIKQLKELLDNQAITQEEYDNKKSEILNRK